MALDIKPINYAEEYHVMKPSLFRESENLDRLLQALFDVCDVQQKDFLWLAENLLNLDAAQGFHLDFIGSIVGQPRFLTDFNTEPYFGYEGSYQSKTFGSSLDPEVGGYWNSRSYFNTATSRQLNDVEYRRLIRARAIYNQSNCTANDLLEVINLLSNSKNNTVQMLRHGLIQINTDDTSGIISYFVDRLLNDDNILPIAAGVRVGLGESRKTEIPEGGGGGSGGSGGGITSGERIRVMTTSDHVKSELLYTYRPEAEGSNGEKVVNISNLFYDDSFDDSGKLMGNNDGWSDWSAPINFSDINHVMSNGGLTIICNPNTGANDWIDMSNVDTVKRFAEALMNNIYGEGLQYRNFDS